MTLTTDVELSICSKQFQQDHPQLYHYTSRVGLEGIVRTNTIWATNYRSLNDSSEIIHLKKPFARALVPRFRDIVEASNIDAHRRQLLEAGGGYEGLAGSFVESLYRATFESPGGFTAIETYITCFCTHAADRFYVRENGLLSQWRGYSGGDGFCIVLETPALCRLLAREFDEHYWVHLQANPVRYAVDDTPLDALFPELVGAAEKTLRGLLSGRGEPAMATSEFLRGATLFKHQGFLEEQEVRIVAIPGTEELRGQGRLEHADFPAGPLPGICRVSHTDRRYIQLFEGSGMPLPIVGVIVGPSRNQVANTAFARSVVGAGVQIVCSATPWIPPHVP
jgi:hypothetical protein